MVLALSLVTQVQADPIPKGWRARGMVPVGYSALAGRPAFKLAIKRAGDHWYLYAAQGGINVIDVTDPRKPRVVKFIPAPPGTDERQVTVNGDLMITNLAKPVTAEEGSGKADTWTRLQPPAPDDKSYLEGVQLWDIRDPADPKPLGRWQGGAIGTHRNSYPGGRYAYLSATLPGYRGLILIILDVSDPMRPKEAGRWWYPGQAAAESPGNVSIGFHGPPFVNPGTTVLTAGYTPAIINLDISDVARPKLIGKLDMIPPFADVGTQSIHTVVPIANSNLLFVNSEPLKSNCEDGLGFAALVDNSDITRPKLLSILPVPRPEPRAHYADFCKKGGRFGPHNTNTELASPDVEHSARRIYLTYFNAGLRVFDISNPRLPTETGWFLPPNPSKPIRAQGGMLLVNQTQDVLVDARGYAYITDSAWGIWVLRTTGPR
jgi:hypothetical protein